MLDGKDLDDVLCDEGVWVLFELLEDICLLVDFLWEWEVDYELLIDLDCCVSFCKCIWVMVNQIVNNDVKEEYCNEFDWCMEVMFGMLVCKSGCGEWQGGCCKINQGVFLLLKKCMGGQMDKVLMCQVIFNLNG